MKFEWDEAKRARTLDERDIDFADACNADWQRAMRLRDPRANYGEDRFIALIPLRDRLHVIVYTLRGEAQRIISMRKANPRKVASYVDPAEAPFNR